jgi:hypothetical protein
MVVGVLFLGPSVVQYGNLVFVDIDDRISHGSDRKNFTWYVFCPNGCIMFTIML